jgi:hypothetical protein
VKLNSWFEIDEKQYIWYILQGYTIVYSEDSVCWYLNNQKHREDGPACLRNHGREEWWKEGKKHRTDGPAVTWADGSKEWWIDGYRYR